MCKALKSKVLVIENTYYSLLLYILFDENWQCRDYYIVNERLSKGFISRLKCMVNSVRELNYFPRVRMRHPLASIIQRKKFIESLRNYQYIYGNIYELKINLNKEKNWIQIDDGEFTYLQLSESYHAKIPFEKIRNSYIFEKILDVNYDFDFSSVNYLVPDTERYRSLTNTYSINFVDMKKSFSILSNDSKNKILKLFGLDFELNIARNLILMQPLFTDGLVSTVEEEIELYRYMLKQLNIAETDCVFKPHPASHINYQTYFPQSEFISNDFPSELISLCNVSFDKVATLFSSGINAFSDTSRELYFFGNLWLKLPVKLAGYKITNGHITDFNPGG